LRSPGRREPLERAVGESRWRVPSEGRQRERAVKRACSGRERGAVTVRAEQVMDLRRLYNSSLPALSAGFLPALSAGSLSSTALSLSNGSLCRLYLSTGSLYITTISPTALYSL
jgi:hypothetical protein